ncbi:15065_t:CDS:2 [Entrophospora sp. SA101]|nr:15065_t:CDS:2 [Entrophospora sp. SA101]
MTRSCVFLRQLTPVQEFFCELIPKWHVESDAEQKFDNDIEYIEERAKLIKSSPSEFAKYENYSKTLSAYIKPMVNCLPANNFDMPITLYHEIFGSFLSNCENIIITDNDKLKTYELQSRISSFVNNNDEKQKPSQLNICQASFPFVNFYTTSEEKTIKFIHQKRIFKNKLVFQIEESLTKIKRILKFVTSYGTNVHKHCFENGIAPELIFVGNKIKNTDYMTIILEDLAEFKEAYEIWEDLNQNQKESLKKYILDALHILQNGNFVHGDFCFNNIMARLDPNKIWSVKIIDFDWTGYSGQVKYPWSLNTPLPCHSGVKPCAIIIPSHDRDMINRSFRN